MKAVVLEEQGVINAVSYTHLEAHFEMNTYDIYKKQLTIQGSFINPLTFKDAISLLESGKMNVAPLISHELGLEAVSYTHLDVYKRQVHLIASICLTR